MGIPNSDECLDECHDRNPDEPVDGKIQEPEVVNAWDVVVQIVTLVFDEFADIRCRYREKLTIDGNATGSERRAGILK